MPSRRRPSPRAIGSSRPISAATKERLMQKREKAITFKGNPVTLVGPQLKAGDKAPDFRCLTSALATVGISDTNTPAKPRLFSVVPSLDTPVCSQQTKK